MPFIKESFYLIEKYGSQEESEMKALARRLSLKYAQTFPATMPSPAGDESGVNIPKAPRVPNIEDMTPSNPLDSEEFGNVSIPTPKFHNVNPMAESEMRNAPTGMADTLSPAQLSGESNFKDSLLWAVEAMYLANVITGIKKTYLEEEIRRARHDAHLIDTYKEIHELVEKAKIHAYNYAKRMEKILLTIA